MHALWFPMHMCSRTGTLGCMQPIKMRRLIEEVCAVAEMKGAGYCLVFSSWVSASLLISSRIFFFYVDFLFSLCDVIQLTGNNMSLILSSVIPRLDTCRMLLDLFPRSRLLSITSTPINRFYIPPTPHPPAVYFIRSCRCSIKLDEDASKPKGRCTAALLMCGEKKIFCTFEVVFTSEADLWQITSLVSALFTDFCFISFFLHLFSHSSINHCLLVCFSVHKEANNFPLCAVLLMFRWKKYDLKANVLLLASLKLSMRATFFSLSSADLKFHSCTLMFEWSSQTCFLKISCFCLSSYTF